MKRSLLYMVVLAVILVLPTKATDVGKLRPVQSVAVYHENDGYIILTDTKDVGRGETISAAVENLKATTPATIYLDTAQYLMVEEEELIDQLRPYLRKTVKLYRFVGEPPMEEVSKFLSAHGDGPTVRSWKKTDVLPVVDCRGERLVIL